MAAHPGMADTKILDHLNDRSLPQRLRTHLVGRLAQTEDAAALPTLYAATADLPGDAYAGPGALLQLHGAPKLVGRSKSAQDQVLDQRL